MESFLRMLSSVPDFTPVIFVPFFIIRNYIITKGIITLYMYIFVISILFFISSGNLCAIHISQVADSLLRYFMTASSVFTSYFIIVSIGKFHNKVIPSQFVTSYVWCFYNVSGISLFGQTQITGSIKFMELASGGF